MPCVVCVFRSLIDISLYYIVRWSLRPLHVSNARVTTSYPYEEKTKPTKVTCALFPLTPVNMWESSRHSRECCVQLSSTELSNKERNCRLFKVVDETSFSSCLGIYGKQRGNEILVNYGSWRPWSWYCNCHVNRWHITPALDFSYSHFFPFSNNVKDSAWFF